MTYLPRFADASEALQYPLPEAAVRGTSGSRVAGRLSSVWRSIRGIIDSMADHYVASAMYEALSRLSDEELHRRGLSRVNLACDIRAACRCDRDRHHDLDRGQARTL
jgi:hypothetical protein